MIFNNVTDTTPVQECRYDANIAGALMLMYENECNYNSMMKAVGLSELKYYQETGKDLFLNEAGAIGNFIDKAKAFFKKVIEKIKSLFHRFAAKINQFTMSNKKFVKKYETELLRKDLTDFEFEGYTFKETIKIEPVEISKNGPSNNLIGYMGVIYTEDELKDAIDGMRARLIGDNGKKYDETEFHDRIKEKLYGDKDTIKVNIREWIQVIANSDKEIKDFDNSTKKIVSNIEDYIKKLEKVRNEFASTKYNDEADKADKAIKNLNQSITMRKAQSQDYTYLIGAVAQQLVDKCKQAKAICVKALGYKNESATLEGSYSDIFSGVTIV